MIVKRDENSVTNEPQCHFYAKKEHYRCRSTMFVNIMVICSESRGVGGRKNGCGVDMPERKEK